MAQQRPTLPQSSTIGAGRFHHRVRKVIVCCTPAIATKPHKIIYKH